MGANFAGMRSILGRWVRVLFSHDLPFIETLFSSNPIMVHSLACQPRSQSATSRSVTQSASTCTEDALFRAVVEHTDGTKLQVDVFCLDLTALIDTRQVVE